MKFLKSTIVTFFTNVFIFGLSFILSVIIARGLGPDGSGILRVSNSIIAVIIIFVGFGVEASNVFFIGKDKRNINKILGVNILVSVFALVCVMLLFLYSFYHPIKFFKGLDNKTLFVTLLAIPVMNLKSSMMNSLLGLQEVIGYNKINILDRVTNFVLMVGFMYSFKLPFWLVVANYISIIIVLSVLFYIIFHKKGYKISFSRPMINEMVKYGSKSQLANLIQYINYRLDVFITNYYLPISQVGIYSNAVSLGETIWQVSGSVATVVFPMTTNSSNKLEMKNFINKTTRITLYIVLFCSAVLVLIIRPLIPFVFGSGFAKSGDALVWLMPGIIVFSISKILANYIAGIGLVEKNVIASTVSAILTVVLDLTLIPRIGIIGASLASSISYTIFTIITIGFYMNITKSSLKDLVLLRREDVEFIRDKFSSMSRKLIKR